VLVNSVSRKILHEPICFLKRRTREEGSSDRFIDVTRRIFNLDSDPINPDAHLDRRSSDDDEPLDCECCREDETGHEEQGKQ